MPDANLSERCILAVGNTGTGKSFTATVFGAQNARVGHSTQSETDTITVHNIERGGFYIDTPGFDDSDEDRTDDDTKRSILFKMLEANIQNITTILWFVVPDSRARASYRRQAKFIDSLGKYYRGNVWDNTIIVTKGVDTTSDGPRDAAREIAQGDRSAIDNCLSRTGDFNIFLFERLSSTSIYVRRDFTSDELNEYGIFKESESERILARYESLMEGHLEHPILLNLRRVKCSKCSEETDPRLAFPKCHLETELFHPETECIHHGNVIDVHPLSHYDKHSDHYVQATTRYDFDNSPQAWTVRVATVGIVNPFSPSIVPGYWKCCNNGDANSRGCKQFYRCCEKDYQSSGCQKIYEGCKHKQWEPPCFTICKNCNKKSDIEGCKERCRNCKADNPHNKEGCVEIPHNFR